MKRYGVLLGFGLAIVCVTCMGAYTGWNYNTADLNGSSSLQERVDDLDNRLDAAGMTSATTALTPTFTSLTNTTLNRCKESIGSKYLMAGPSATYSWGMEAGTVTLASNGAGLFTNTYTYVRTYAAAPFPVASYAAAVGNVTNAFTTGQTTNVLISGGAAVAVNVIVTGRIE